MPPAAEGSIPASQCVDRQSNGFIYNVDPPRARVEPSEPEARPAATPASPRITARDHLHPQWYIRCTMYMVAFLHTRHRVTFRAAGLILICLGFILSSLVSNFAGSVAMPRTLKTVFTRFDINDHFDVHPICFHCHHVFEPEIDVDTFCPDCNEEVFGAPFRGGNNNIWEESDADPGVPDDPGAAGRRKPYMVSPIQLLSTGLQDFFKRPGMVSAVNSWRTRTQVDGELRCRQDAQVWKETKDVDGNSFFFGPQAEKEIRLGVSFSLDWYVIWPLFHCLFTVIS